jgi:hypothetical protein
MFLGHDIHAKCLAATPSSARCQHIVSIAYQRISF